MYASVIVDAVIGEDDKTFDYIIPEGTELCRGARVLVPFGGRNVEGFVLDLADKTQVPDEKIKPLARVLDTSTSVLPELLVILDGICDKYKLRKIDVLRLFVPSTVRGRKKARTPKNREIRAVNIESKTVNLTEEQRCIADTVISSVNNNVVSFYLLHGVTGSGKTEVYMKVIESVLEQGKTAIMLVPEIGLTPQVLANFRARFGGLVAILHSGLTTGERFDEWYRLAAGGAKIAVGARSAVFAPLKNLGVIIIDEEHDGSYASESNPRFYTHEIAKIRCKYNKCPLVLGSATPSIESYQSAVTGEYTLLKLDKRVNNLQMPVVEIADMAAELRSGNGGVFSRSFLDKLLSCMDSRKQAIIFLNRRGFSSSVICKNCGWVAKCENCDVSLVYHKHDSLLKCHYCGGRFTPVTRCPRCSSAYLKYGATGTQKLVEELEKIFPEQDTKRVQIFRMDADSIKNKNNLVDILDKFGSTPRSILVGTQMVAKGHHFPNVSLVGIIDADNSLHFSDYRAAERTFALITQVAGRAGRDCVAAADTDQSASAGHVVLQTYIPTHYVYRLAANYDYVRFFEKEINTRLVTKYPPFTTVVRILVTGERDDQIKALLQKIMIVLRAREKDFVYLGAMKSPVGRIQNKFRYQILARIPWENEREMLDFMNACVKECQPKSVKIFLEINPQSLS